MSLPHILIAPNAYKGSLDAIAAADAIAQGFEASRLACTVERFPIGDGGDGTARALVRALDGRSVPCVAADPYGRPVEVQIGLVDDGATAVIELADASGLHCLRLEERDPWRASTYGTGLMMRHALDLKVRRILLGVGGSATVDGGIGILHALGVRFLDHVGRTLAPQPLCLPQLHDIDSSGLDPRLRDCAIEVLCDVRNPLIGERGAAAIFGPQKGATAADVAQLDAALERLADIMTAAQGQDVRHRPYGGAAGGVAAGLMSLLGANAVEGIDYFLEHTHFDRALRRSQLVVTGEGSIDAQTLEGKAPFGVAQRAHAAGVPVIVLAGIVPLDAHAGLNDAFEVLSAIGEGPADLATAMSRCARNLRRKAHELGNTLHIGQRLRADPFRHG